MNQVRRCTCPDGPSLIQRRWRYLLRCQICDGKIPIDHARALLAELMQFRKDLELFLAPPIQIQRVLDDEELRLRRLCTDLTTLPAYPEGDRT